MKEKYICKIATYKEIEERCNYEIDIHNNKELWIESKKQKLNEFKNNNIIVYIGVLDNKIICEATAVINNTNTFYNDLINKNRIYLEAFRTNKEYQNLGYFSCLYKYMEKDLLNRGYKELSLGVEPNEIKNILIYFKYGFTNYIKTDIFTYSNGSKSIANYYYKKIN